MSIEIVLFVYKFITCGKKLLWMCSTAIANQHMIVLMLTLGWLSWWLICCSNYICHFILIGIKTLSFINLINFISRIYYLVWLKGTTLQGLCYAIRLLDSMKPLALQEILTIQCSVIKRKPAWIDLNITFVNKT